MPKYLPDGQEDSAEMIVGVRDGSSVVRVNVWREAEKVCCKYGAKTFRKTLKHEPELVNIVWMLDPCPGPITLRLTGAAAEKREYPGEYILTAGVICLYRYFEIFLLILISFPTAKSFLQRIFTPKKFFGPSAHKITYKSYISS